MNNVINIDSSKRKLADAVFELKVWRNGGDSFTSKLFDLICKADLGNRNKLRQAFPSEVAILEEWQRSRDEESFFKKWGVII